MKWILYTGPFVACWVVSCATRQDHARIIGEEPLQPGAQAALVVPAPRIMNAGFRQLLKETTRYMPDEQFREYKIFRSGAYPSTFQTWSYPALLRSCGRDEVHINLSSQRGLLLVDGVVAMDFPVCTGMESRPTPTGSFHILEKDMNHRSNLYDNAPMRCFMRLTWDGVGLHVGLLESRPASHGCIRLPEQACRQLFSRLPVGATVTISQ